MNYDEFDTLVEQVYGQSFSVQADQEAANGSALVFSVQYPDHDDADQAHISEFASTGKGDWLTNQLLQDMVNRNIILAGRYLIRC